MAELTPSSVKSSLIEWCHASARKTKHMVLDPNCAPFPSVPDVVANPEMSYHLNEASPWGYERYFSRGVGVIVLRQVIVKNASNNKLQFRRAAER